MIYFADTKCPMCGTVTKLQLGAYGFFGNETTICPSCKNKYDSVLNCISMLVPDDYSSLMKSSRLDRLLKFTTQELEEELQRRRSLEETLK